MGSTRWSDEHHEERGRLLRAAGRDAFEHDEDVRKGRAARRVHQKVSPLGVTARESRDSDAHPESHAVAVLFDVTGSMRTVPRILQENLPRLMGLLIRTGYLEHPHILTGAIGDATCDDAALQVGQFEAGIEIEEDLARLFLEGGGGGGLTESYDLAMYFMARHTSADCFEKRGKRGYLFIVGDEAPYKRVKRGEVEALIGDTIQADIPTADLVEELKQTWDTYFVVPRMTHHYNNESIHREWVRLLGQNVLRLEEPAGICDLLASTIGLAEGKVDLDDLAGDLREAGAKEAVAQAVGRALVGVGGRRCRLPGPGDKSGVSAV